MTEYTDIEDCRPCFRIGFLVMLKLDNLSLGFDQDHPKTIEIVTSLERKLFCFDLERKPIDALSA